MNSNWFDLQDGTLSEKIRQYKSGVILNPYQGNDKKVLFVCSMGILRSATGSRIYGHKYNTRSAGTHGGALIPLTEALLEWADQVVFVNRENWDHCNTFLLAGQDDLKASLLDKAVVLNIPDQYEHMHPEIIKAYKEQFEDL